MNVLLFDLEQKTNPILIARSIGLVLLSLISSHLLIAMVFIHALQNLLHAVDFGAAAGLTHTLHAYVSCSNYESQINKVVLVILE